MSAPKLSSPRAVRRPLAGSRHPAPASITGTMVRHASLHGEPSWVPLTPIGRRFSSAPLPRPFSLRSECSGCCSAPLTVTCQWAASAAGAKCAWRTFAIGSTPSLHAGENDEPIVVLWRSAQAAQRFGARGAPTLRAALQISHTQCPQLAPLPLAMKLTATLSQWPASAGWGSLLARYWMPGGHLLAQRADGVASNAYRSWTMPRHRLMIGTSRRATSCPVRFSATALPIGRTSSSSSLLLARPRSLGAHRQRRRCFARSLCVALRSASYPLNPGGSHEDPCYRQSRLDGPQRHHASLHLPDPVR